MCFDDHVFRVFHNGWIICRDACFSCCSLFITLRNGLKMSEYEVYWLTDIPYNLLGTRHEIIMVISQKKENKQV